MSQPPPYGQVIDAVIRGDLGPDQANAALQAVFDEQLRAFDDTADTLRGLSSGIQEFQGVGGKSSAETAELLRLAQRRFAIQVQAVMRESAIPDDTLGTPSVSVRRLRKELVELAEQIANLVETTIRDSQLRKDMELAGTVQKMLVPPSQVKLGELEACAWYRPAETCSGDWWSLARLGKTDHLLVIGDVTGHGAAAAMVAAQAKGAFDMARVGMRTSLKPFMAMNMINHILIESLRGEYFMTALVARIDLENRTMRLANAGHRTPWIFRDSGLQAMSGDRSPPLGSGRGTKYGEELVQLESGDLFVCFTDGIPEAEDADGAQFGDRELKAVCESVWREGPEAVCDAVRKAVEAHVGSLTALDDDVTLIAVRVP